MKPSAPRSGSDKDPPERHWDEVHSTKRPDAVSWYQEEPARSLELVRATGVDPAEPVIDVGAGASFLVDRLLEEGFLDLTVLDVSAAALSRVRERLGSSDPRVAFVRADVLAFRPERRYAVWHDRAVFHFLTEAEQRRAYLEVLSGALEPGGHLVVATFAPDGPSRCSGLSVARYDARGLAAELGHGFELVRSLEEPHRTPSGGVQPFQYCLFRRVG